MNATARQLGHDRTHFANFDGLPWPTEYSTYSTAADLITLGRAAMSLAGLPLDRGPAQLPARRRVRASRLPVEEHRPAARPYPGAIGIKTGYTLAAGHCLLFEATRDGRTLIGVTLDSPGPGTTVNGADATRILNWAFGLPGR